MAGPLHAEALGELPLLAGLSAAQRAQLATEAVEVRLDAGEWLFHEGDDARSAFVVRSGRLDVVAEGPPAAVIRSLKRGSVLGELSLLQDQARRTASVRASRDSVLLQIGREQLELLIRQAPDFAVALTRIMGAQLAANRAPAVANAAPVTVAVVGLHPDAPAAQVQAALVRELAGHGTVARLGHDPSVPESGFTARLDQAEHEHDRVVLVAGAQADNPAWADFCLREADLVLAVTHGDPDGRWLDRHEPLRGCELLVCGRAMSARARAALAPREVQVAYGEDGIARAVAATGRRLAGRATGLVLSGGGARAFAHLGVLEELHASGVRFDRIGGVSMGALIGALAAMGLAPHEVYDVFTRCFVAENPTNDYTLPAFALIRGRKTRRLLDEVFGARTIEELPHRFFCVSSDLVGRRMHVHRTGLVREAVYASLAIPGVFPPHPDGTRLLVDGGVLDNLPVQTMAERPEGPIIAVDVSHRAEPEPAPQGPLHALRRPLRRALTGTDVALPRIGETLMRTLTLGSSDTVSIALRHADLVIAPRVDGIGLLDWRRLEQARRLGREAAREALGESRLVAAPAP